MVQWLLSQKIDNVIQVQILGQGFLHFTLRQNIWERYASNYSRTDCAL